MGTWAADSLGFRDYVVSFFKGFRDAQGLGSRALGFRASVLTLGV